MPAPITPVILSGGSGTRLWPISIPSRPKQFIPLISGRTMFAETMLRVSGCERFNEPIVVASNQHADLLEQEEFKGKIIYEPCPRGTAPAIALAALEAGNNDQLILVLSSDHAISNIDAFLTGVSAAASVAQNGKLVCLGVEPSYPETGYGYIELGESIDNTVVHNVTRFVEKPALSTAQSYLDSGNYVWNAGIFLFRSDAILSAIKKLDATLYQASIEAWHSAKRDVNCLLPETVSFEAIKSGAIDTVVMEQATNVACVGVDMGWSDVGSWDALYQLCPKSPNGNVISGQAAVTSCKNMLIRSENIPIAIHGVSNLIVVATKNGVLVVPQGQSQQVKLLVESLQLNTD